MKKTFQKSGFVFLMVLVVVAIGGTVLGTCAYHYARKAMATGDICGQLQLKWGTIALRKIFLDRAEEIISDNNEIAVENSQSPKPFVERKMNFGGLDWQIILADEQAKVNINILAMLGSAETLEARVYKLQKGAKNSLKIKPGILNSMEEIGIFTNPEEIFDYSHPRLLLGQGANDLPLKRITFWGSGLLNFNTADLVCLSILTEGVLNDNDIQSIDSIRQENSKLSLDELIKKLTLSNKQTEMVKQNLTDTSKTFSLWVVADEKSRKNYRFFMKSMEDKKTDVWSYQW